MNLFEVVKANINTQEAAQTYGIDVNHYGMALCPFHIPMWSVESVAALKNI